MTEIPNLTLEKIRDKLAAEARAYMQDTLAARTDPVRSKRIVLALSGIEPRNFELANEAKERLQNRLARQRRYSRLRSSRYDLNLHIALSQALNAMTGDLPNKKGR